MFKCSWKFSLNRLRIILDMQKNYKEVQERCQILHTSGTLVTMSQYQFIKYVLSQISLVFQLMSFFYPGIPFRIKLSHLLGFFLAVSQFFFVFNDLDSFEYWSGIFWNIPVLIFGWYFSQDHTVGFGFQMEDHRGAGPFLSRAIKGTRHHHDPSRCDFLKL